MSRCLNQGTNVHKLLSISRAPVLRFKIKINPENKGVNYYICTPYLEKQQQESA